MVRIVVVTLRDYLPRWAAPCWPASCRFLAGVGPVQVCYGTASTLPLIQLPLALIPTVAVLIALTLYVSLTQLRRHAPEYVQQLGTTPAAGPAAV